MNKLATVDFSILTATGRGAIATVTVVGDNCFGLVDMLFRSARGVSISELQIGNILYGQWLTDGRPGEDLIVCPLSPDRIEIHCHGGQAATDVIAKTLLAHGANRVTAKELVARIFKSKYLADFDLAITKTSTWKTAQLILKQKQLQLRCFERLNRLFENREHVAISEELNACLQWGQFGEKLTSPWSVVLCGQPNVGKSSLINRLVGFQRSIVHSEAGTTRDLVHQATAIDGWPVEIVDTAGIRKTEIEIEQAGIELATEQIQNADLIVLVVDSSGNIAEQMGSCALNWSPQIVVANKSDLAVHSADQIDLAVSAKTNSGIDSMIKLIAAKLVPALPPSDQAFPVSAYQLKFFERLAELALQKEWDRAKSLLHELGV